MTMQSRLGGSEQIYYSKTEPGKQFDSFSKSLYFFRTIKYNGVSINVDDRFDDFWRCLLLFNAEDSMSLAEILKTSLSRCEEAEVMRAIEGLLAEGRSAEEVVSICNEGMGVLGQRFDDGEAFIPDLMFAGMIMKKAMAVLEPMLSDKTSTDKGKTFLIGTVRHDVHDIGKDITAMVLRGNGFNVIDLGVDVSPEAFVEAIRRHDPDFLGMSVLLTTCYKSVTETMDAIREAGLDGSLKTCLGGAAASQLVADRSGIDFYGKTAVECVNWAKQFR